MQNKIISSKIANMGILCALMVVFIHMPHDVVKGDAAWWACQLLTNGICRMAVPFFFAASGYLLAGRIDGENWYATAVQKRLRTLLVPLIIWNILYWLWPNVLVMLANFLHGREAFAGIAIPSIGDMFRILSVDMAHEPYLNVLWFVRTLFIFVVLSPLLLRFANYWVIGGGWLVQCVINPTLAGGGDIIAFSLLKGVFPILGASAFMLGMALRRGGASLSVSRGMGAAALIAAIGIAAGKAFLPCPVCVNAAYFFMIPLAGIGVWALCPAVRLPEFITNAAFAVYVMHQFVLEALPSKWVWSRPYDLVGFLSFPLAAFAICVVIFVIVRRMLPSLARVIYGGRV